MTKTEDPATMLNGKDNTFNGKSLSFESSDEAAAFELNTNDQDLFPIITCSSLMTPRAGVWGGGGGGGGSGVGVGHPPPPPFPSPIHRSISRASPTDLRTHSRADSRGSTDLQNGAHMFITPPASAGSDTLVLTPDLPKEEREKRASARERCIALLKEQLSDQTPVDGTHRLEVLTCSKLFEAPPAATPAERSTRGVHDEHVEDYKIDFYHSLPSVRSDAEEAPSVRDVKITSEARGICMYTCTMLTCMYVRVYLLCIHTYTVFFVCMPCTRVC
jgi:hypothetical protein